MLVLGDPEFIGPEVNVLELITFNHIHTHTNIHTPTHTHTHHTQAQTHTHTYIYTFNNVPYLLTLVHFHLP